MHGFTVLRWIAEKLQHIFSRFSRLFSKSCWTSYLTPTGKRLELCCTWSEYGKSVHYWKALDKSFPVMHGFTMLRWMWKNLYTIFYSLLSCDFFFARSYNLHVKIRQSPVIRKIGCNFCRTHLSMVKVYIFGTLWARAFQWCMVLLCSDEKQKSYGTFSCWKCAHIHFVCSLYELVNC